jgi:hypothetical protein
VSLFRETAAPRRIAWSAPREGLPLRKIVEGPSRQGPSSRGRRRHTPVAASMSPTRGIARVEGTAAGSASIDRKETHLEIPGGPFARAEGSISPRRCLARFERD